MPSVAELQAAAAVHDDRPCELGEGPLWHPLREELFWFDITGCRLLARRGGEARLWRFDRQVSAAAWVDARRLLIASETDLALFDLDSGRDERLCPLEADRPETRSNDGRADPHGGFWIGTMGKAGEAGAGAIWRYRRGELRCLHRGLTVPNAICFAPGGGLAYFADTRARRIWRQHLDPADGWPVAEPEPFLDFDAAAQPDGIARKPDGAVTDAEGCLWNAQWGSGRVARYSPEGVLLSVHPLPVEQTSCPAFGGAGLTSLFVTSARQRLDAVALARQPLAGQTFRLQGIGRGRPEPAVRP